MRRWSVLFLLPLLSLACSFVLYEPGNGMAGQELDLPSITATTTEVVETAFVCNVKAELGLNLRDGAGMSHAVLSVLPSGSEVEVVESQVVEDGSTWKKVVEGSGISGWVNGRYLCPNPP